MASSTPLVLASVCIFSPYSSLYISLGAGKENQGVVLALSLSIKSLLVIRLHFHMLSPGFKPFTVQNSTVDLR